MEDKLIGWVVKSNDDLQDNNIDDGIKENTEYEIINTQTRIITLSDTQGKQFYCNREFLMSNFEFVCCLD